MQTNIAKQVYKLVIKTIQSFRSFKNSKLKSLKIIFTQITSLNMNQSSSFSDEKNTLLSILTCLLCQQPASQAHICPNCSKFFCFTCITGWILDRDNKCPYCTEPLEQENLVNCQHLFDELSNAMEAMKLAQIKRQKKCSSHHLSLNYYCKDCQIQLCSDCSALSTQHNGHQFLKTTQAKKQFEKENTEFKNILNLAKQKTQKLLQLINQNPNSFEQILQKDQKKFSQFIKNLKQRTNKKFISQITELQKIIEVEKDIVEEKNEIYDRSMQFMKDCSKIQFVAAEADLLQQKISRHLVELKQSNVDLKLKLGKHLTRKFESEIYPSYQRKKFSFLHFGQMCYQNNQVYSDYLEVHGVQWRLKIYPAGNHEQTQPRKQETIISSKSILDSHISIFVQMKNSIRQKGKYRHKVVIEHRLNKEKNIEREFESQFDRGECWGYDKFAKISHLYDGGFVDQKNQQIDISLLIAPANYYEACEDMKTYIIKKRMHLEEISGCMPQKVG